MSLANDETYTWACCREMTAFSDTHGTASLSYNDLGRMTSFTDTQGNQVQYEYDSRGRTSKVTPAQGSSYRTEYQYNLQGTLSKVRVYDSATYADTDYTYSATTGKLTQRDFPEESSQHIRTSYSYDTAGRLEYETITREAGGTTNLTRTTYAQTYSTGDHYSQQLRTEETGSGASWINSSRTTYRYDGMNRQDYEKREDYLSDPDPAFVQTYLIEQEYDKKGNRTRLDRNVTSGHETEYGQSMDLGYTYNTVNALTAISDADDANYECTVTCDANNNITLVEEAVSTGGYTAELATAFSYDWANRMETNTVSRYLKASKDMVYTKREHEYDAAGRLVNSTYKNWLGGEEEPTGDTVEHCYAGSKHVQNTDGSSSYGGTWHWAGASYSYNAPVKSPNADTASQDAYNLANAKTPQRRTWQSPTSAGDERNLYGQGKPMAKDSSGAGLDWSEGITSDTPDATVLTLESRLDFDGTVAPTDLSRATDAREKGRIGIFGSQLSYAGSSGRVTSEPLGRDLNPLGRGDGGAYVAGAVNLGVIAPRLPGSRASGGNGNSVNNCGQCGGGGNGDGCGSGSSSSQRPDVLHSHYYNSKEFDPKKCHWCLAKRPNIPSGPYDTGSPMSVDGNFDPGLGGQNHGGNTSELVEYQPQDEEYIEPTKVDSEENEDRDNDECTPEMLRKKQRCMAKAVRRRKNAFIWLNLVVMENLKGLYLLAHFYSQAIVQAPVLWLLWMFGTPITAIAGNLIELMNLGRKWWRYPIHLADKFSRIVNQYLYLYCITIAKIAAWLWWKLIKGCDIFNQFVEEANACCDEYPACCKKKGAYFDCNNCISPNPFGSMSDDCWSKYGYSWKYGISIRGLF